MLKRKSDDLIVEEAEEEADTAVQPKSFYRKDPKKSRSALKPSDSKKSDTSLEGTFKPDNEPLKKQS